MENHAVHVEKPHEIGDNGPDSKEKQHSDELTNGGSEKSSKQTMDAQDEPVKVFNEEIIKNIAVEKELSEIASAYNLHRTDSKTEEEMEVDPPKADESCEKNTSDSGKCFYLHFNKKKNILCFIMNLYYVLSYTGTLYI